MQALAIFEYPEFIMAAVLGLLVLIGARKQEEVHFPGWYAEAAKACLSFAPVRYLSWINRSLMYAGWRNQHSFGDFASLKLSFTLASLLFALYAPPYALP